MVNDEVGKRIRKLRKEQNLTREVLSEKADISTKFLYEIEMGKKGISAETLLKVSTALSVSCDYLMTGEGTISLRLENMELSKDNIKQLEKIMKMILGFCEEE